MTTNPYLDAIHDRLIYEHAETGTSRYDDVREGTLAAMAVAHELARMNDRTDPVQTVIVVGLEDLGLDAAAKRASDLVSGRGVAVPDGTDGDRRIAAAARRWAERYAHRNEAAYVAGYHLSCSELAQVVREVDAR